MKYGQKCFKIQVIFCLQRLFSFKDKLSASLQSYVIYHYRRRTCNSWYIGKTGFYQIVRRHLNLTPFTNQPSASKTKPTAVYEHMTHTNHQADLTDFEVIGRDSTRNDFLLKVKESLFIKRRKPKINENEASTPLFLF